MSNQHPFRHMRLTMRLAQAQCALLLGTKEITWSQREYAMFFTLNNMIRNLNNPTYKVYVSALGAYLRFCQRLVKQLPESKERDVIQGEFDKVAANYGDLLEVQPLKQ